MKNVRFTGNSANLGGAIYAENDFTLIGSNVHFTGNTATQGGGIYAAKNLTLHAENGDIVFTGNYTPPSHFDKVIRRIDDEYTAFYMDIIDDFKSHTHMGMAKGLI